MDARTVLKARLLDLTISVLELVRDGHRDLDEVCRVFQTIKDSPCFFGQFFALGQPVDVSALLADHHSFYRQFFGLDLDFSSVRIPERRVGFDRLIVVAQGLTPNKVYEACAQRFQCWRYTDDLDAALDWDQEERNPKDAPYAIWVRDRREADGELKNLSANQIKKRGLTTETLTECLVHGAVYFYKTGEHLGTNNITLCAASRVRGGLVPGVDWDRHDGEVRVSYFSPGRSFGVRLRAREVVS